MERDKVYEKYNFVKKQRESTYKTLLIASLGISALILFILGWGFLSSLDIFKSSQEKVTQPIKDPQEDVDKVAAQLRNTQEAFSNAGIPYNDPAGRYNIGFSTPYPSGDIFVMFQVPDNTNQDLKKEADARITRARELVDISKVSYINNY